MPELPEVEFAARILRESATGRTIVSARTTHPAVRRSLPLRHAKRLVGRRIVGVARRGKHQLLTLDDGSVLHVHFGMAGDWAIDRVSDPIHRYARFILDLDDGHRVSLIDSRVLGRVKWNATGAALPKLGPDATDPALDGSTLGAALTKRRGPIKPVLLDQRVVAGVGNIYASEALWLARIDPRRSAASLGRVRRARLAEAIRDTMSKALVQPARYYSEDEVRFDVYDRAGEPCPRCGTKIKRIIQATRSTYWCPRCQR